MRLSAVLLTGTLLASATPAFAEATAAQPAAQPAAAPAQEAQPGDQAIVVTARKREETLQNVPVAVTAVSGDVIEKRGFQQIKDVAQLTPSLNTNSDSTGRVFIAIRGIGTTLVGTVQPGVGIFIDGIYQPNTAYLNNPLVDVERVEVLRGPQGTLYGKNTLGGAINVVTRQPSNTFEGRAGGSYAGPDNAWDAYGSISGPIVADKVQFGIAASHTQHDGFIRNTQLNTDANPLSMDSVNGTLRVLPGSDVVLTVKGYYDWVRGGNIPYSHISGTTDYSRTVNLSAENIQKYTYKGANAKLQFPISGIDTNVTWTGAYDQRDGRAPDEDGDFNAFDFARQTGYDRLKTSTTELRFDSNWSSTVSTLFGLFYSHETLFGLTDQVSHLAALPAPLTLPFSQISRTIDSREGDTYAAYGTIFWKPSPAWEAAIGLRLDHEKRVAGGELGASAPILDPTGTLTIAQGPAVTTTPISDVRLKSTQLLPKFTLTRHWSPNFMTYGSIAKGFRGGGFNGPTAPFRTYKGDSVWTYELGSKYSMGRKLSLAGALFYNDYKNFIGLNQFVLGTTGSPVTVDLNTGDVKSYGAELEFSYRPVPQWTITGGGSYVHARITNFNGLAAATGNPNAHLGSRRLPFQPDFTGNINSDYVVPVGDGNLTFTAGVVAKGSRVGASLNPNTGSVLKGYALVNGALTYSIGKVEIGAFVNNLFNKRYMESFIEKTTLANVFGPLTDPTTGQPLASDLGIIGDLRRVGVRARVKF
ncbi:MAG TPA: TonB-dependent receptor [Sphingomicrobium sp.]|jgi:iron complex outermembrane receptor protein